MAAMTTRKQAMDVPTVRRRKMMMKVGTSYSSAHVDDLVHHIIIGLDGRERMVCQLWVAQVPTGDLSSSPPTCLWCAAERPRTL